MYVSMVCFGDSVTEVLFELTPNSCMDEFGVRSGHDIDLALPAKCVCEPKLGEKRHAVFRFRVHVP